MRNGNLLIGIRIHKDIERAIIVGIIHLLLFKISEVDFVAAAEGDVLNGASSHILDLDLDDHLSHSRLILKSVKNNKKSPILIDNVTRSQIVRNNDICHILAFPFTKRQRQSTSFPY